MSAVLPWWQAEIFRALDAAGHSVAFRVTRNGTRKVAIDGQRETLIGAGLRKAEAIMDRERSWPWMRAA